MPISRYAIFTLCFCSWEGAFGEEHQSSSDAMMLVSNENEAVFLAQMKFGA